MAALEARPAHAGAHPLDDQVALELGDHRDDDHHGPAEWAAGVELLAEADELDIEAVEFVEDFQEVAHGAGQPVAGPYEHDIELSAAGLGQHLIEARAARLGSADAVGIFVDHGEAPLQGQLPQVVDLGLGVLVER